MMYEPTWGQIIVSTINAVLIMYLIIRLLGQMPLDGSAKPQKIKKIRGYKYTPTVEKKASSGFDWLSYER